MNQIQKAKQGSQFKFLSWLNRYPKFLTALFLTGMWEHFAFSGMRVLLVLYLTSQLGFTDKKAYAIYSLFATIGYAAPVLSGFLADQFIGFYNMVLIGGIVMVTGHLCMSFSMINPQFTYFGLALIGIGTGLFKGNITNLLGACYKKDDPERYRGFSLFYVGVNLGSFAASILCAYTVAILGWHYGFALAGMGMLIGLISFIKAKKELWETGRPPRPDLIQKKILLGLKPTELILLASFIIAGLVSVMLNFSEKFVSVHMIQGFGALVIFLFLYVILILEKEQRKNLIALAILTFFSVFFFSLEMQLGSLINLFVERNVVKEVLGFPIPAAVSQAINPLSIIIVGFLFSTYFKFNHRYFVSKFAFGMLTVSICFFILYLGCLYANSEGKVGYWSIILGVSFIGMGKFCLGPAVQVQATVLAPKHLRGLIMGILMLSFAFSKLAGGIISKLISIPSIKGEVDPLQSLHIYQEGFLTITKLNLILVAGFALVSTFTHQVITQTRSHRLIDSGEPEKL